MGNEKVVCIDYLYTYTSAQEGRGDRGGWWWWWKNQNNTRNETKKNAPIAVIRRTPHRDDRAVKHELVPLHRKLVRARDECDRVVVCECLGDVRAKEEPSTARGETPSGDI